MRVLKAFDFDGCEEIFWRTDGEYAPVTFLLKCNDLFRWGCADAEAITDVSIGVIEATRAEFPDHPDDNDFKHVYWPSLAACRIRKMRPQKPYYASLPKSMHAAFDACGPERGE